MASKADVKKLAAHIIELDRKATSSDELAKRFKNEAKTWMDRGFQHMAIDAEASMNIWAKDATAYRKEIDGIYIAADVLGIHDDVNFTVNKLRGN